MLAVLLLVACGGGGGGRPTPPATARRIVGADGEPWIAIRCEYVDNCLAKAGQVCPAGYTRDEANTSSQREGHFASNGSATRYGASYGAVGAETNVNVMVIKCKGHAAAEPIDDLSEKAPAGDPHCGHDFDSHGCQGSSKWVEESRSCEPCSTD